MVSHFTRAEAIPEKQFSVADNATADSGPQRQQDKIARATAHAVGILAKRRTARIVTHKNRYVEVRAQGLT